MISLPLAQRVKRIKPSPTLAISAKAAELRASGQDIINLSVGEPDFDTPEPIKAAAIQAIRNGITKYTAVDGMSTLKRAIITKLARENQLAYEAAQIIVSTGAKQAIFNLALALLDTGDEVIIPAPYWVSYPDIVRLAGAEPVFIQTSIQQNYKITPEQLSSAITPKTRLFILNSPSNPSGMAYTAQELKALGAVLKEWPNLYILSDDIYEHILWQPAKFTHLLNVCPELYHRTVIVNGVSKAYAMTGWRIGYAAGPHALISAMGKIQSQSTSNANSIAQIAAQAALCGDQTCIQSMVHAFRERHQIVYQALQRIPGVECRPVDGTFYTLPDFSQAIASMPHIDSDIALADYLLDHARIAVVPGSAFGAPNCLRLSFATSNENLTEAMTRLTNTLSNYYA